MIRQIIYLEDWKWVIKVFYETEIWNARLILQQLEHMGCSDRALASAEDNLTSGKKNTGLTYSNVEDRTTLVAISCTTSANEFANTFYHEVMHCAFHIAGALGIDPYSEEFGYLSGAISSQLFRVAKKFMCDCCRNKGDQEMQ